MILSAALSEVADSHSAMRVDNDDSKPWEIMCFSAERPDTERLNDFFACVCDTQNLNLQTSANDWGIEPVPEIDWLAHSYQQFPPFSVGPFFIYGSHYDGDVPEGLMGLQIDAATAFGSGEHGTTAGCLQAMLDLKGQGLCPWHVLDMGTGSGILAIAAWKLWKTPIIAVDNDPESVRVTERHREANKVPEGATALTCAVGEGFAAEIAVEKKPYELIIANILAGPLKEMAGDMKPLLDDNGYVILSGILNEQAESVTEAYTALGLTLKKRYEIGEWSTLVLHNGG